MAFAPAVRVLEVRGPVPRGSGGLRGRGAARAPPGRGSTSGRGRRFACWCSGGGRGRRVRGRRRGRGPRRRRGSPAGGSTLTTSAPRSASTFPVLEAAKPPPSSTTRKAFEPIAHRLISRVTPPARDHSRRPGKATAQRGHGTLGPQDVRRSLPVRQVKIPAAFVRGGTSNAVVFDRRGLPEDEETWDDLFIARPREPRSLRTPARRHGRRSLVSVEGVRRRAAVAPRCGRGLHVRTGRGGPCADRLERQLRQHVLRHRPLRGGRGAGRSLRGRGCRGHPQHQHDEAHPRPLPGRGRAGGGRGERRDPGRIGCRRSGRSRIHRAGRGGHGGAAPDRKRGRRTRRRWCGDGAGIAGGRGQPVRLRGCGCAGDHGRRDAGRSGRPAGGHGPARAHPGGSRGRDAHRRDPGRGVGPLSERSEDRRRSPAPGRPPP